jgi:hypothetical protein
MPRWPSYSYGPDIEYCSLFSISYTNKTINEFVICHFLRTLTECTQRALHFFRCSGIGTAPYKGTLKQ